MIGLIKRSRVIGRRKIFITCVLMLLLTGTQAYSQLVLNEMMPFNMSTISDQFNEYPDWLEVYNSGTETEYLGNYSDYEAQRRNLVDML